MREYKILDTLSHNEMSIQSQVKMAFQSGVLMAQIKHIQVVRTFQTKRLTFYSNLFIYEYF